MTGKEKRNDLNGGKRSIYVYPLEKRKQKDMPFASIGGGMSFKGKVNTLKTFWGQVISL